MLTTTLQRGRFVLAALLAALAVFALVPESASAQETETRTKEVTVQVENDRIFVNGQEVEADDDGRVTLQDEDGEEIEVLVRKRGDRTAVWSVDPDTRMFRSRGGNTVWSMFDEDDEEGGLRRRLRIAAPHARGMLREFEIQSDLAPLREEMRALRGRMPVIADEARARVMEELATVRSNGGPTLALFGENEELVELEREIRELALDVRRAEDADRGELEAQLDRKLSEAFDLKQESALENIQRLTERLEEARKRQQERSAARGEIIENRKRELLGKRGVLDW